MVQRLTEAEIEDLKYLMGVYSRLWQESEEYTQRLEEISAERDDLIAKIERHAEDLDRIREQESILEHKLKERYGEFKLDMETFEIFKVV